MAPVHFEELSFGSEGYGQALALRQRILRDPLGITWTADEQAWEARERHFALVDEGMPVACVVIRPLGKDVVKLRQMAVDDDLRGRGLGRFLLERVENVLHDDGIHRVELNARDVAVGFYGKLGYTRVGEEFIEVTIPHWKMVKELG